MEWISAIFFFFTAASQFSISLCHFSGSKCSATARTLNTLTATAKVTREGPTVVTCGQLWAMTIRVLPSTSMQCSVIIRHATKNDGWTLTQAFTFTGLCALEVGHSPPREIVTKFCSSTLLVLYSLCDFS